MTHRHVIEHYGVKGMKWGVRKQRSKKEEKVISKRAKALKNVRTLSNDDIKAYTDRLSSEKKLKELLREDLSPGRAMAQRVLGTSGEKVAKAALTGASLYAIKAMTQKKFSVKEFGSYMTPKPKKA